MGLGSYFGDGRSGARAFHDGITSAVWGGMIAGGAGLIGVGLGAGTGAVAGTVAITAADEGGGDIIPGSGGVGGAGATLIRFCSEKEATDTDAAQGFVARFGWTRVFPEEVAPRMGSNPFFQNPKDYSHMIVAKVGPGWGLPVDEGGAFLGRDVPGYTVAVPEINQFIQSIVTMPRSR